MANKSFANQKHICNGLSQNSEITSKNPLITSGLVAFGLVDFCVKIIKFFVK